MPLEQDFFLREAFANMLKTNSTLTRINLRWNNVGDEGGKAQCSQRLPTAGAMFPFPREALAQAESSSSNVCEIELYGTNIGASCLKAQVAELAMARVLFSTGAGGSFTGL